MIFDPSTDRGAHALERLETARAGWLTTVRADGQPQSMPVWFVWQDGEILVYGDHRAKRNANLEANPRVSFHLPDNGQGQDIVTIEGTALVDPDFPQCGDHPGYWAKYGSWIDEGYGGAAKFGQTYSMPIRITPTRAVVFQG
jgi:PPOX class probable F420-dependent enzyme